jgi:DNA-binding NtrC family response regulator
MTRKHTVLVVDDEEFVRESLVNLLECEGFRPVTAGGSAEALEVLRGETVSVVVTDLSMPEGDGIDLLTAIRRQASEVPVIVLTGVGTIGNAVTAMKEGAFDFIQKPFDPEQFVHLLKRAIEHTDLVTEVRYLRHAVRDLRGPTEMVGSSRALGELRALIAQVAASDVTVLVTGESGTGKDLVAAEIHRRSRRAERNMVRVNCAAVTESLFESEFFGHRRGAFTGAISDRPGRFAEAEGGTLVLDEIGTLRPEMQAKLLRVLETGDYQVVGESRTRVADVRVIAVTNEDLAARMASGAFRTDLFYRLNVFPIGVPPLRRRKEDIPELAEHFLRRASTSHQLATRGTPRLAADAAGVLLAYDWPGNVRELRNIMERAAILSGDRAPGAELFGKILGTQPAPGGAPADDNLHLRTRLDALERRLLEEALARSRGRKREAASLLGIDPKNLSYYMKKHSLLEAPLAEDDRG